MCRQPKPTAKSDKFERTRTRAQGWADSTSTRQSGLSGRDGTEWASLDSQDLARLGRRGRIGRIGKNWQCTRDDKAQEEGDLRFGGCPHESTDQGRTGRWIQTFPHSERGFAAECLQLGTVVRWYMYLVHVLAWILWVPSCAVLGRTIRAFRTCVVNPGAQQDAQPCQPGQSDGRGGGRETSRGGWLGWGPEWWDGSVVEKRR